jgi:hypothetical protein
MAGFPPSKGNKPNPPNPSQVTGERGAISTGSGGLTASKAMKNAAIKPSPGIEKVNSAS